MKLEIQWNKEYTYNCRKSSNKKSSVSLWIYLTSRNQATTKLRQLEEMNMSAQGDTQKKVEHLETLNKSQDDRIQELNAMVGMKAIW